MKWHEQNPYESPVEVGQEKPAAEQPELAPRLTRLGAVMIDAFLASVITLPITAMTGYFGRAMEQRVTTSETVLYSIGGIVVYLLLHGYLLATQGQSIGKNLLRIRIVDYHTGQLVSFEKLVGLRLGPVWLVSVIPFLGCLGLLDILFIFGHERRCLHDLIAGTMVVPDHCLVRRSPEQ